MVYLFVNRDKLETESQNNVELAKYEIQAVTLAAIPPKSINNNFEKVEFNNSDDILQDDIIDKDLDLIDKK